MLNQTIPQNEIEIRVIRDHNVYTHKCIKSGLTIFEKNVPKHRARQIIDAHPGQGETIGLNPVTFEPGAHQFTWCVRVRGEG